MPAGGDYIRRPKWQTEVEVVAKKKKVVSYYFIFRYDTPLEALKRGARGGGVRRFFWNVFFSRGDFSWEGRYSYKPSQDL